MKPDELKRILKPLIKECINEILMGEYVQNIIKESAGRTSANLISESVVKPKQPPKTLTTVNEKMNALSEHRKRLEKIVGTPGLFDDVKPIDETVTRPGVQFDPEKLDIEKMKILSGIKKVEKDDN
jgi:hypothetical protein